MKEKFNIKNLSRRYKKDVGGLLFLKSKIKFKFIKKWVNRINENMMEVEKKFIYEFDTERKKYLEKRRKRYKFRRRIWYFLKSIGAAFNWRFVKNKKKYFNNKNYKFKNNKLTKNINNKFKNNKFKNNKLTKNINNKFKDKKDKNWKNKVLSNNRNPSKNPNQDYWIKWKQSQNGNMKKKKKDFRYKNTRNLNSKRFYVTHLKIKNSNYIKHKFFNKKLLKYLKKHLIKFNERRLRRKKKYFHENSFVFKYNKDIDFNVFDTYAFLRFFRKIPKRRLLNFVKYGLRMLQENKRLSLSNRLFKKKQQFKFFFRLKELQLKNLIKKLQANKFYLLDFYYFLEYRLDMLLYRAFYFQNIATAQQFIKNYGVYIDNVYTKEYDKVILIGSKIQLPFNFLALCSIIYNLKNKYIILPPKYLEINYSSLSLIIKSFFLYNIKNITFFSPKWKKNQYKTKKRKKYKDQFALLYKNWYSYYLINERKKYKRLIKNKIKVKRIYRMLPIHYPFKITLEEIDSIFHL